MDGRELLEKITKLSEQSEELLDFIKQLSESDLPAETGAVQLRLRRLSQEFDACQKELASLPSDHFILTCSAMIAKEQEWIREMARHLSMSERSLKNAAEAAEAGARVRMEQLLKGGQMS